MWTPGVLELPLFPHLDAPKFACSHFHLTEGYIPLWFFCKAFRQQQKELPINFIVLFISIYNFYLKTTYLVCWSDFVDLPLWLIALIQQTLIEYLSCARLCDVTWVSLSVPEVFTNHCPVTWEVFCSWGVSLRDCLRSHASTASLGKMPLTMVHNVSRSSHFTLWAVIGLTGWHMTQAWPVFSEVIKKR